VTGIESVPTSAKERFKPSAEVHWCWIRWYFDVSQISGAIPGGDIEAAAQRDGEVGKIATDAALLGKCLLRSPCRAGMFVAECDVP
jgi:hypothetical protein